jgi:hypothetical protein
MERLLQNSPMVFQTSDMKTIYNLNGLFSLDNCHLKIDDNDTIIIDNIKLKIYKNPEHIGGSFWLSSIGMILYIKSLNFDFSNKTILELGCGVALPSMYLSYFSNNITISDLDPSIGDINCKMNNIDTIKSKLISWSSLDSMDNSKYNVIIASDCVYRNTWRFFLDAIKKYFDKNSNGMLLICNPYRDGWDDFVYALSEYLPDISQFSKKITYDNYYIELEFIYFVII